MNSSLGWTIALNQDHALAPPAVLAVEDGEDGCDDKLGDSGPTQTVMPAPTSGPPPSRRRGQHGGTLAADIQIRLSNTTLTKPTPSDFFL